MPGPALADNLVIEQQPRPDYNTLRAALTDAENGRSPTEAQAQALEEIRLCRVQLSNPLDASSERPPNPSERQRISGLGEITISVAADQFSNNPTSAIRLGADLVSVAVALSDELHLNELDSGALLYDARSNAAHRPDHDVVAAAKEMFFVRRRESVFYLQEIFRAGLLPVAGSSEADEDGFIPSLMRERDALVVEHGVVTNIVRRLEVAADPANAQQGPRRNPQALQKGEFVLLAETLFLLAYTVQLTRDEAIALRALLDRLDDAFHKLLEAEKNATRGHRAPFSFQTPPEDEKSEKEDIMSRFEKMSPQLVELESARNLVLLSWACALDRARYHDIYDPRTGSQGVNVLLKDLNFIPRTSNVPQLAENEEDTVSKMSGAKAAAELCGAVFRLAVADPDEAEALHTALRACAYAGALSFLSTELASWISKRAGSLCPDTDLYADVVEDLALDIAEAPQLVSSLITFTQNDISAAASETAYASLEMGSSMTPYNRGIPPPSPQPRGSPVDRRSSFGTPSRQEQGSPSRRRLSGANSGLGGKPPRPPGAQVGSRPSSNGGTGRQSLRFPSPAAGGHQAARKQEMGSDVKPSVGSAENLIASLASFIGEAISLAPTKLGTNSIGGGARYWSGIGASGTGVIQQIGDAVIDLWDASMRNPYAPGGVGAAFREALVAFLSLLACTAQKEGSPTHASSALQFLRDSGQTAASLDRASDAMSYFHNLLSSPASASTPQLDEADVDALRGIINVIANAAETLRPHGGILLVLGDLGKELAMRMSSLAVHEIPASLRESLINGLCQMDSKRAISLFLENVAGDKSAPLRHFLRGVESQAGTYEVTIKVLNLATQCVSWPEDEYPEASLESIAIHFTIEEVLAFWSRRKYTQEANRWRVVKSATEYIRAIVLKDPRHERSSRILAQLLAPAPGTGAASYALRALICAAGLMRAGEESEMALEDDSTFGNAHDRQTSSLYHVHGRDSLVHAAEHGLGEAYREMQLAAEVAARMITLILSVPFGRISGPGVVVAPAAELLIGEIKAISSAASLVFSVDSFLPSVSRAGYNQSVCAAVLGMLASAAQESFQISSLLAKDPSGTSGSAAQFRASLANIISRSTAAHMHSTSKEAAPGEGNQDGQPRDPPIMHSVLSIVEACLGDGGGASGLFLLGLRLDSSGLYASTEYGVLGALVELVAGAHDGNDRVDDKCRATAATFLESLAANTVRRTSLAVLEHLKEVAEPNDPIIRGGGFADEMLFRILEAVGQRESGAVGTDVDWAALGELLSACMSLSALQVRIFPKYEVETCISSTRSLSRGSPLGRTSLFAEAAKLPSPLDLLKLLASIAGYGQVEVAFEALRTWCHLLGSRLGVHERNTGYASIPLLFELTFVLLGALSGTDSGSDMSGLVRRDEGKIASSMTLLCIARMRDCDNPHEPRSEESISDVQCTALLTGVVRALACIVGVGADASFARTSLYAALLICGSLAKTRMSEDAIGRAFGGRLGPRQVTGTEAVIAAACADAVSGPTAAAKAVAMAAASMTTLLDPVRAMPALGSQNRLRRVLHGCLADPEARVLIAQACSESPASSEENTTETARERAAIAVTEAALALIHAVSSSGQGARIIADSGCIESASSLLPVLSSSRTITYSEGQLYGGLRDGQERRTSSSRRISLLARDDEPDTMDFEGSRIGAGTHDGMDVVKEDEMRISMIAAVSGAIAASICSASNAVVESTVTALDTGKGVFQDVIRGFSSLKRKHLEAVSSLGVIISRIPYDHLTAAATPTQLRMSLASAIGAIIPPTSNTLQLGGSGSPLSAGINLRRPESYKDARRRDIIHPEGGSLFERDLIEARALCAQNVFAALRAPSGLLFLFKPQLVEKRTDRRASMRLGSGTPTSGEGEAMGHLSEVVRICKAMLQELKRAAEESMQIDTRIASESATVISSRRVNELASFCQEEFGIEAENLNGQMVVECLRKTSAAARRHADRCMSIFEGCLFILREYVRTARETVRGNVTMGRSLMGDEEGGAQLGIDDAEMLLNDAKGVLVPICKEVEGMAGGVWGGKDSSFSKQLGRQIRTACTGR